MREERIEGTATHPSKVANGGPASVKKSRRGNLVSKGRERIEGTVPHPSKVANGGPASFTSSRQPSITDKNQRRIHEPVRPPVESREWWAASAKVKGKAENQDSAQADWGVRSR